MTLRFDPYGIFIKSATPVGLYARKKWLGQENDGECQRAFDNTVASLLEGQFDNGSWNTSFIDTVRRLFGLHLTIRYATGAIHQALDWLFDELMTADQQEDQTLVDLDGLPFVQGRLHSLHRGMALFLATVFGRENDHEVIALYHSLSQRVLQDGNIWDNSGDVSNIFRALVVHPIYAKSSATARIVEGLLKIQEDSGIWAGSFPFYMTVNALAHLDIPSAEKQLEKAFVLLSRTQNQDGTWGNAETELNTFLVVHAMRNKKILL